MKSRLPPNPVIALRESPQVNATLNPKSIKCRGNDGIYAVIAQMAICAIFQADTCAVFLAKKSYWIATHDALRHLSRSEKPCNEKGAQFSVIQCHRLSWHYNNNN